MPQKVSKFESLAPHNLPARTLEDFSAAGKPGLVKRKTETFTDDAALHRDVYKLNLQFHLKCPKLQDHTMI